MLENVEIKYLKCAKKGFFQRIGDGIEVTRQLSKLIYKGFESLFMAGTMGAYWVDVEGQTPQSIWLICPDNFSIFWQLNSMTLVGALDALAAACNNSAPTAWQELATWLTNQNSTILAAIQTVSSMSVAGLTLSNIPTWSNINNNILNLFLWLKSAVEAAQIENNTIVLMSDCIKTTNSFEIEAIFETSSTNFGLTVLLQI